VSKKRQKINMSKTPRTEEAKFSGIHAHPDEEYVDADFARELERENTHLLVLATNAEFNRSKLERKNARLQMELDASCNAEELRQVRAENARLQEAGWRVAKALECARGNGYHGGSHALAEWATYFPKSDSSLPNVQAQR
jgi:hypothetical protein